MNKNVKNVIIKAAIQLIEQRGSNLDSITIRDICEAAHVGTGLVNYHFQSKDKLIENCVQIIIGDVINKTDLVYKGLEGKTPEEKLRIMAKYTCGFLAENENISRISILTDMSSTFANDNTLQTVKAFLPIVKEVCYGKSDEDIKEKTYFLTLSLQGLFLRSRKLKEEMDFDFFNKGQRDKMVDKIIDLIIKNGV
ncbi:MAG: helix-turn-helix domain-containing protein [Bacillota bacterium]|nr:helix-turn-helix domain-containing protein [Bacillota bacterium]